MQEGTFFQQDAFKFSTRLYAKQVSGAHLGQNQPWIGSYRHLGEQIVMIGHRGNNGIDTLSTYFEAQQYATVFDHQVANAHLFVIPTQEYVCPPHAHPRAQKAFAERMERYARASGHSRLVELLSGHNKEHNDKFALSDDDDDDQVRTTL